MPRRSKEDTENNPLEHGLYAEDNKKLAEEALMSFFSDKSYYRGGPVPIMELCSEHSVKTLLRTRINDRWDDIVHNKCLSKIKSPDSWKDPIYPYTVNLLVRLFYNAQSKGISKEFIPGLVVLYFKFCKGFEVPNPPPSNKIYDS